MCAAAIALMLCLGGCLPDPQREQSGDLLDQLAMARLQLLQQVAPSDACSRLGDVETRLYGEPGLVEVQPAWSQLTGAAHALQAVCGQGSLLAEPSTDSPSSQAARQRWQQGIQRELGIACDHLRAAADALGRQTPC
jgi:hypothetical protein